MKSPLALDKKMKWVGMAILDIVLVSIALPLNFYVALLWDSGEEVKFWVCLFIAVLINAVSYALGWFVSWSIFKRAGNEPKQEKDSGMG